MIAAIIVLFLICLVLLRLASAVDNKFWKLLMINLAILVAYNVVIWGCISLFWSSEESGMIPAFFDIVLTTVHLLVLLIMMIVNAARRQKN
jgi:uncharacterized membrane protein